jgi:hypothetical protein
MIKWLNNYCITYPLLYKPDYIIFILRKSDVIFYLFWSIKFLKKQVGIYYRKKSGFNIFTLAIIASVLY